MATVDQRVSYLEGKLDSLATKADLYQLENKLIRWMVAVMLGGMATAATLALAVTRLIEG